MRQNAIIFVNGRRYEISDERVFQPLSDFLRRDLRLTGTKVVCAEGDCGSCTILVGRPQGDRTAYEVVCSCIQLLGQLDGAHVVTVEGLKYDGELNPLQRAMVACHGAQCGYCTGGFVVAMHAMYEKGGEVDETTTRRALTGNLCRCTGYEPILRAAAETEVEKIRRCEDLYPSRDFIEALRSAATQPMLITLDDGRSFYKPATLQQAAQFRAGNPSCTILAGGTDVCVQLNKRVRELKTVLCVGELQQLHNLEFDAAANTLSVGAGVSLSRLADELRQRLPAVTDFLERFGSPQIRNAGTLAGNLANASPIGDMLPPLFVLDAQVELICATCTRIIPINEFYIGYRKTQMRDDEMISRVIIPLPSADEALRLYKVSRRFDLDISTFSAAIWMKKVSGTFSDIRIAFGGVGPTVVRLKKTEDALRGRALDGATIDNVSAIVQSEISTITDVRGSAEYRKLLATNILRRLHAETASGSNGRAT